MFPLDLKLIGAFLGAAASAVGIALGISRFVGWIRRKRKRPHSIEIKHIRNVDDPDLTAALALYDERIEDTNQKDGQDDIVRWLKESKSKGERARLREDFLVATRDGRVVGGLYAQYYSNWRLLFVSYLFVRKGVAKDLEGTIAFHLVKYLRNLMGRKMKKCQGVLFEVEPKEDDRKGRANKNGRINLFRSMANQLGLKARQLEVNYLQPKLSLWDGTSEERRLVLLYVRLKEFPLTEWVPRDEVKRILSFVYEDLYGDCYMDSERKNQEYRDYLRNLYSKVTKDLPEQVPLS